MKRLTINIILPFLPSRPGGGAKVMYEYANRLSERGHEVTVVHSIKRPFKKTKTPVWWKLFLSAARRIRRPKWFPLDAAVRTKTVPSITDRYLPDADITLSTWWEMVYMTTRLNASKGLPFNLIQGNEIWAGFEEKVYASYALPATHVVIAKYLQELFFSKTGKLPVHIPVAIDTKKFRLIKPVRERDDLSILMLYSTEAVKDTGTGLLVLSLLKKRFPGLRVTLFGVKQDPDLPEWIQYHCRPSNLVELYNGHAVFFSPSISEGWALPPAEAMACGCAVVCTAIGGHADYAIHEQTALLAAPKDVDDMTEKLNRVLIDHELKIQLAVNGHALINDKFNWDSTVLAMEEAFYARLRW